MPPETCSHKDTRKFDNDLICLSCGILRGFTDKLPADSLCGQLGQPPETSQLYRYSGLSREQDEIRLIVILPGVEKDLVCCRIITTKLKSPPDYTAVSYTWATEDGDSSKSQTISVVKQGVSGDFKSFVYVTSNCEATLKQLRQADKERVVWVDAVCIDQSDVMERNHQVGLMEHVYERASQVEICIQDPNQDYEDALELLGRRASLRGTPSEDMFDDWEARHHAFLSLRSLFSRKYFSRVWVIQEVIFAKVAMLHVNQRMVPYNREAIENAIEWCRREACEIPLLTHWASLWRRDGRIIPCLRISLACNASDPRDNVFAIASLLVPYFRNMILIDYQSDLQSVYRDAIGACIEECRDLSILEYCNTLRATDDDDIYTVPLFTLDDFVAFLASRTRDISYEQPCWILTQPCSPWMRNVSANRTSVQAGPPLKHVASLDGTTPITVLRSLLPNYQVLPRLRVRAHLVDDIVTFRQLDVTRIPNIDLLPHDGLFAIDGLQHLVILRKTILEGVYRLAGHYDRDTGWGCECSDRDFLLEHGQPKPCIWSKDCTRWIEIY